MRQTMRVRMKMALELEMDIPLIEDVVDIVLLGGEDSYGIRKCQVVRRERVQIVVKMRTRGVEIVIGRVRHCLVYQQRGGMKARRERPGDLEYSRVRH